MRRHPSNLLALICALFMLVAQYAGHAHWIGHLNAAHAGSSDDAALLSLSPSLPHALPAPATYPRGDDDRSGDEPSEFCSTCVAFTALASAPPTANPLLVFAQAGADALPESSPARVAAGSASPYPARAPPSVL